MKRLLSFTILITLLLSISFTVSASSDETVRVRTADGIVRSEYVIRSDSGTQRADVLEIDLTNPRLKIKLLTSPEGASYLENVKSLANHDQRVVAAINGDFFAWYSQDKTRGSAVGLNYSEGEMISSAPTDEELASLVFTTSGAVLSQYFKPDMSVTTEDGRTEEINSLNKFDSLAKIAMYTSPWGKTLHCEGENQRIAVVEEDRVVEIISSRQEVLIPENGYLLAGLADHTDFFDAGIKVGSKLRCDVYFDPYFDDIETAIGGGTVLVKNGAPSKITHMRYGRDFRSATGVSEDGKTLYMITVDKNSSSIGMTLYELQEFMLDIGVYDGINLDGGGSTQLVARGYGDNGVGYVNSPENGYYRPVVNALAVVVTGGQRGEFLGITAKSDKDSVNIFDTVTASFTPYDELFYPLDAHPDIIPQYTFSGVEGKQSKNKFTPTEPGTLKIKVSYDGYTATKNVKVNDPDLYVNSDSRIYHAKTGEKVDVAINAITLSGNRRNVPLDEVSITVSGGIATVSGGVITAKKPGFGSISFKYGDFAFSSYLSVDGVFPDDANAQPTNFRDNFETTNGYAVSYPTDTLSAYKISNEQTMEGDFSGKLWFDFDNASTALQSAYFVFENPPKVFLNGAELNLQVYSPGFENTLLKAMVTDRNGNVHRLSLGDLKEEGIRSYSLTLPSTIPLPATLSRLYVVEGMAESKERGAIYFDNLTLVAGKTDDYSTDSKVSENFNPSVSITAGIANTGTLLPPVVSARVEDILELAPASYSFGSSINADNALDTEIGNVDHSGQVTVLQYKSAEHLSRIMPNSKKAVAIIVPENSSAQNEIYSACADYTDKDIFVISKGTAASVDIRENIRFITIPTLTPSLVTNQRTFVTLEIGTLNNNTVYRLNRTLLWNF